MLAKHFSSSFSNADPDYSIDIAREIDVDDLVLLGASSDIITHVHSRNVRLMTTGHVMSVEDGRCDNKRPIF